MPVHEFEALLQEPSAAWIVDVVSQMLHLGFDIIRGRHLNPLQFHMRFAEKASRRIEGLVPDCDQVSSLGQFPRIIQRHLLRLSTTHVVQMKDLKTSL